MTTLGMITTYTRDYCPLHACKFAWSDVEWSP